MPVVVVPGKSMVDHALVESHSTMTHILSGRTDREPGEGLNLGTLRLRAGAPVLVPGFDGYRFGYVDDDHDGRNDLFQDANDRTGTTYGGGVSPRGHGRRPPR